MAEQTDTGNVFKMPGHRAVDQEFPEATVSATRCPSCKGEGIIAVLYGRKPYRVIIGSECKNPDCRGVA